MEMTLRWYGPGYDSVTLKQIRQIPGVKNVITTLFGKQAGELWLPKEIAELKKIVNDAMLPSTSPATIATNAAMPPSFADTLKREEISPQISRPLCKDTPQSP